MANIKEVEQFVCEKLNVETLEKNKTLAEYGIDSLDSVEMAMDLEERFGISFENEDYQKIKTVGDLLSKVEEKLK